jgi:DNA-binding Lrp family transcriptional regulator
MVAGVLIKTSPGKVKTVLASLRGIPSVKYAYAVFGRYDLVAMIEAENIEALTEIIVGKIGAIDGVTNTETLIKAPIE